MPRKPPTVEERFWKYVRKSPARDCWEWVGAKARKGYGNHSDGVKKIAAHRFSYQLHCGPIPDGLWVLHKCDNPPCVKPTHFFLGTHADNMADAARKGRIRGGRSKPRPRAVSAEQVRHVLKARGILHRQLSEMVGVHVNTLGRWLRGEVPIGEKEAQRIRVALDLPSTWPAEAA